MMDFFEHGRRDPYSFIEYTNSYYNFILKVEKELKLCMNSKETKLLEFYSKEVLNTKRAEEVVLISLLIAKGQATLSELNSILYDNFKYIITREESNGVINILNGSFLKEADAKNYGITTNIKIIEQNNEYIFVMSKEHAGLIKNGTFGIYLNDAIKYSFYKFKKDYDYNKYRKGFLLYEKYSRKDACRILNWDKDESSTIYGYRIKHNSCPIFVTYHKGDDITGSTKYEDTFINSTCFSWMTRNRVTLDSKEAQKIKEHKKRGIRIPLFIKKSDGEGTDFYYMGDVEPIDLYQTTIKDDKGKVLPIVNIKFGMLDEVEESIYQYLES